MVDKFLINGFAPKEYGNESINIKSVISTFIFKRICGGMVDTVVLEAIA
jgi:hypothetical protein